MGNSPHHTLLRPPSSHLPSSSLPLLYSTFNKRSLQCPQRTTTVLHSAHAIFVLDLSITQIVRILPRFAVMLGAMILSICFIVLDVLSVTSALKSALPVGINPFWKLSFVFKCLTDSVVLDDFKTALDRLRAFKLSRLGSFAMDGGDTRAKQHLDDVKRANNWPTPPPSGDRPQPVAPLPTMPGSPDGDYIQPPWGDIKPGPTDHIEDRYSAIARNASRDRDADENGFDAIDYGDPQREASDAHILRPPGLGGGHLKRHPTQILNMPWP